MERDIVLEVSEAGAACNLNGDRPEIDQPPAVAHVLGDGDEQSARA